VRSCNCGQSGSGGSGVRVVAGEGIIVTGSGTPSDPLMISSEVTSFASSFLAQDTSTVDMNLVGSGTQADPFVLSATAALSMQELSDVNDPSGPAFGEVPVYNGSAWEFAAPPTQAPGLVNATGGIVGDGTIATPLKINVVDTAAGPTTGLVTYIDTAGKLRAVPGAADWNSIANKPTTFDTTWDQVAAKPAQYPDAAKINGHRLFVQAGTPTGTVAVDDLWVKKP
jgi:hypothetical protein